MSNSLISAQTRVESPFVILRIGDFSFGHCAYPQDKGKLSQYKVTYPNFMTGLNIKKINGAVNTYTIKVTYAITQYDDPNLLERVFSSISDSRQIFIEYGDWMLPAYIYREEEALLTKVSSSVDFNNSKIEYTLTATSNSLSMTSIVHEFPAIKEQPSKLIKDLLNNETYGLLNIFYGMKNKSSLIIDNLIDGSDKKVTLKAKTCSILEYINYLVSCMTFVNDSGDVKSFKYYWATYDDINNQYEGPYFKVVRVGSNINYNLSYNAYEIDIGYPSGNFVSSFSVDTNDAWSLIYKHSKDINLPTYTYDIDNEGNISTNYSPAITKSSTFNTTDEQSKAWWSTMTQYPISAKITIKGLLRPALLMSYLKVNSYFYGKKHISSGLYIINKQEDSIDASGFKTTLSLTRVSGDEG